MGLMWLNDKGLQSMALASSHSLDCLNRVAVMGVYAQKRPSELSKWHNAFSMPTCELGRNYLFRAWHRR
jgi:hypothetical protein